MDLFRVRPEPFHSPGEVAAIMAATECLARWAPGHSAPTPMVGASAGAPPVPALRSALMAFASELNL